MDYLKNSWVFIGIQLGMAADKLLEITGTYVAYHRIAEIFTISFRFQTPAEKLAQFAELLRLAIGQYRRQCFLPACYVAIDDQLFPIAGHDGRDQLLNVKQCQSSNFARI